MNAQRGCQTCGLRVLADPTWALGALAGSGARWRVATGAILKRVFGSGCCEQFDVSSPSVADGGLSGRLPPVLSKAGYGGLHNMGRDSPLQSGNDGAAATVHDPYRY